MNHLDNSVEDVHVRFVDSLKLEEKDWVGRRGPLEAEMASRVAPWAKVSLLKCNRVRILSPGVGFQTLTSLRQEEVHMAL